MTGKELREKRLMTGKTQNDVAEMAGCSRVWINMLENGRLGKEPIADGIENAVNKLLKHL